MEPIFSSVGTKGGWRLGGENRVDQHEEGGGDDKTPIGDRQC